MCTCSTAVSAPGSRPTCRWRGASPARRADRALRGPAGRGRHAIIASFPRHFPSSFPGVTHMSDQPVSNGAAAQHQNGPQFSLEKIYVKDVSFEAPGAPGILNEQAQPQLQMNLNQRVQRLNDTAFEVVLGITLTCTIGENKTAYLAEVQQAGVFSLTGFDDAALDAILGTHCPNVLYPYVRQTIGNL